ncbi:toll/interleukin-1 receptor domain-containing protein [Virgibacillus natechei]|uniref:toll/interleukin-1 receptor domain-containing protein n=1 Tax=Virgibacillus sp. CBA3643 TaxID=2942278 RepID=UPI0035A3D468
MNFFVSHSSKDFEYGDSIVQLLRDIGIPQQNITFTSKPGYGIPRGKDIFNWLKNEIKEEPFVIYLLSERYYSSIACLNEMGAAWIIENEHIALFTPEFNPTNPKFWEGALEPRELGVFIDNKQDIIEFVEQIANKFDNKVNSVIFDAAITKFMDTIENIKQETYKSEKKKGAEKDNESAANDFISHSKVKDESSNYTNNDIKYKKFKEILRNGKFTDEELFLIKYMIDMGQNFLGYGWQSEGEIQNIANWESANGLGHHLSSNYEKALNKLKIRNFLEANNWTSYGNPKEYILVKEVSDHLLDLPEDMVDILDKTIQKYMLPF